MFFQLRLNSGAVGGVGDLYTFQDALILFGPPWGPTGGNGGANQNVFKQNSNVCPPEVVVRNISRAFGHVESAANFA